MQEFLEALSVHRATIKKERLQRSSVDAPDFNALDFLRDDETGLSRIIAWLLDPKGSHGQEDAFLRRFLEHFGIDIGHEETRAALVRLEAPTALISQRQRRIDVHVRIGQFTLAIENKPWASWQGEQVRAYLMQLGVESPAGHCLVLIKGRKGNLPETQLSRAERKKAIAADRLVDSDYPALHAWVEGLSAVCKAPRICSFLDDFGAYILRTFGEQPVTTAQEDLAAALLNDTVYRHSALELISASGAMLGEIAKRGENHLREAAANNGYQLGDQNLDPRQRYCGSELILDDDAPFRFKVEFDGYDLSEPFYGLYLPGGATTGSPYPILRQDLETSGGRAGKSGTHWIWWRWADDGLFGLPDRKDEAGAWERIASGEFAAMTIAAARRAKDDLHKARILPWGKWKRYRVS